MEAHELTGKEFKLIVLKKLSELQETRIHRLMKSGKWYPPQNEKFNKEEEV